MTAILEEQEQPQSPSSVSSSSSSSSSSSVENAIKNDNSDKTHSTMNSSQSSSKVAPCVCFDLEPQVQEIESIDDLPDNIYHALWFTEAEMKGMIAAASQVLDGTNKDDAYRGLEHCSYEGAQRRRHERSKASEAVLGEQLRQQAAKACEDRVFANADELIAQEYRKVSQQQQELAYERAQQDEADASDNPKFFRKSLSVVKRWFSERQLVQPIS